jgi:hypothetical protein
MLNSIQPRIPLSAPLQSQYPSIFTDGGCPAPDLGGRAFDVSHAQRRKALLRATASTFYRVQLLSAIAAAAVHTREK